MYGIGIEFDWAQFPDYILEELPLPPPDATLLLQAMRSTYVKGVGSPLTTRPLDQFPDLYLELEKADPSPAGHIAFAKKFGLLTDRQREGISVWPEAIQRMRELIALVRGRAKWTPRDGKYAPYEISSNFILHFKPKDNVPDEMQLSIAPRTLRMALTLQCLARRASGAIIRPCEACGSLFEVGGTSGHRAKRRFCSDSCRFDFNNRRKRAGQ